MKKKPGVMVYFDMRRMVKLLTDSEKGKLFEAILDYGETGTVGELTDTLRIIWPLVQHRLDTDSLQYDKKIAKRKYASHVRWTKEHNEPTLTYDVWLDTNGYDLEDYSPSAS